MRYRFDQFELDTKRFSLRAAGGDIHVEPLVFDLLRLFVENAGQVLSREAIIERVWEGRFVSDATVSSCVKAVRKALGDSGENQNYMRTIRGRGFQFTASVESVSGISETSAHRPIKNTVRTWDSSNLRRWLRPRSPFCRCFPCLKILNLAFLATRSRRRSS